MPGFNPLSGPSLSQLSKLAGKEPDPQLRGDATVKLNLGNDGGAKLTGMGITKPSTSRGGVSMPTSGNTTPTGAPGNAAPVPVVTFPTSGGSASITPPGTSPSAVLSAAAALATEDEWQQPFAQRDTVEYIKGPDGVVRPTITITGPHYVGPPSGGGAPPPPPEEPTPSYTSPPLVSAQPKKKTPWLMLGLAAAVAYAVFS